MKWKVLREDVPNSWTPISDQVENTVLIGGIAVYDDEFAPDGSEWGDDESNKISNQQQAWQAADEHNRTFACSPFTG